MSAKDVILDVSRVKSGEEAAIRDLYEEIRSNAGEARELLDRTGVLAESAFLYEDGEETYFVTYIESEDWERTQELYQESDHELDQKHLEVLSEALDGSDEKSGELHPALHVVAMSGA